VENSTNERRDPLSSSRCTFRFLIFSRDATSDTKNFHSTVLFSQLTGTSRSSDLLELFDGEGLKVAQLCLQPTLKVELERGVSRSRDHHKSTYSFPRTILCEVGRDEQLVLKVSLVNPLVFINDTEDRPLREGLEFWVSNS
jgi:hypothetical protein